MAKRLKKTALPRHKQRNGAPRSAVPSSQGRETEIALIDQLLDRIDQGGSALVINQRCSKRPIAGHANAASPYELRQKLRGRKQDRAGRQHHQKARAELAAGTICSTIRL
jgi:hypothetical protein